jgi:hypothetical protein
MGFRYLLQTFSMVGIKDTSGEVFATAERASRSLVYLAHSLGYGLKQVGFEALHILNHLFHLISNDFVHSKRHFDSY